MQDWLHILFGALLFVIALPMPFALMLVGAQVGANMRSKDAAPVAAIIGWSVGIAALLVFVIAAVYHFYLGINGLIT